MGERYIICIWAGSPDPPAINALLEPLSLTLFFYAVFDGDLKRCRAAIDGAWRGYAPVCTNESPTAVPSYRA
jgi:hypothetical protein